MTSGTILTTSTGSPNLRILVFGKNEFFHFYEPKKSRFFHFGPQTYFGIKTNGLWRVVLLAFLDLRRFPKPILPKKIQKAKLRSINARSKFPLKPRVFMPK